MGLASQQLLRLVQIGGVRKDRKIRRAQRQRVAGDPPGEHNTLGSLIQRATTDARSLARRTDPVDCELFRISRENPQQQRLDPGQLAQMSRGQVRQMLLGPLCQLQQNTPMICGIDDPLHQLRRHQPIDQSDRRVMLDA